MSIEIKRIYAPQEATDGTRVLVDRLWPRGISKERAALDAWMKNVAPSTDLRIWFDHRADRMEEFAAKYRMELETDAEKRQAVADLEGMAQKDKVTLLYGAKDSQINHAIVLKDYIEGKKGG